MIDFPNAPTNGQIFSAPNVTSYSFDGVAWNVSAGAASYPDAPSDTMVYGRRNGAWSRAVATAGDTMTGPFNLRTNSPLLVLNKQVNGSANEIQGLTLDALRWKAIPGDQTFESGSNVGSDYTLARYNDAGTFIDNPLSISRATGDVRIPNVLHALNINSVAPAGSAVDAQSNLNKGKSGQANVINGYTNSSLRWQIQPGNSVAETGSNIGSDFGIYRYSDTGAYLGGPLQINRATGQAYFENQANFSANIYVAGNIATAGSFSQSGVGTNQFGGAIVCTNLLNVAGGSAIMNLNKTVAAGYAYEQIQLNGVNQWQLLWSQPNTGDMAIANFNDAGTYLGLPFQIARVTGQSNFATTTDTGWVLGVYNPYTQGGGIRFSGPNGAKTIRCGGGNNALEFVNSAYNSVIAGLTDVGRFNCQGYGCRSGMSGGNGTNLFNFFWTGAYVNVYIDDYFAGTMNVTSDERVKHAIAPLPQRHDDFMGITPISYLFRTQGIFLDDGRVKLGFSAQNVNRFVPEAVEGDLLAVNADGTPNPASINDRPLLALTVLEVQALWKRISTLESRVTQLEAA